MIFSITGAGSEHTRRNCDPNVLKDRFIEKTKQQIDNLVKDSNNNFTKDPKFCFAKVTLDRDGHLFVILCSEKLQDQRYTTGQCHLELVAYTITSSGNELWPLCKLMGTMDQFYIQNETGNKQTLYKNNFKPLNISYINSIGTLKQVHFEGHGIGRELILFWQEISKNCSDIELLALYAANRAKNQKFYENLGFKMDKSYGDSIHGQSTNMTMDLKEYAISTAKKNRDEVFKNADKETLDFIEYANEEFAEHIKSLNEECCKRNDEYIKHGFREINISDLPFDLDEVDSTPWNNNENPATDTTLEADNQKTTTPKRKG